MKTYFLSISLLLAISSCNSGSPTEAIPSEAEMMEEKEETVVTLSPVKTNDAFLDGYFNLKDALVETDYEKAQIAAEDMAQTEIVQNDVELAELMDIFSQAPTIDEQREVFFALSNIVFGYAETLELETPLYRQFCPMAFEGGAFWISTHKEIRNPYFGDEMLTCGYVEKEM